MPVLVEYSFLKYKDVMMYPSVTRRMRSTLKERQLRFPDRYKVFYNEPGDVPGSYSVAHVSKIVAQFRTGNEKLNYKLAGTF